MSPTKRGHKPIRQKSIRDAEATREALLQAGAELFAAHGYDGVSVDELSERAGANKAMINYHFGGKRGLYRAILTSTFDEIGERVRTLATSDQPVPAKLAAFIDLIVDIGSTRRPAFPALFLRELLSGALDREVLPRLGVVVATMMQIIGRGVKDRSLRPVDPFSAYFVLISPLSLFLATDPLRRRAFDEGVVPFAPPSPRAFATHLKNTTLRGLLASPGKKRA